LVPTSPSPLAAPNDGPDAHRLDAYGMSYSQKGQVANLALTAFSEVRSVRLSGVRV
jgi:hypothetical protein